MTTLTGRFEIVEKDECTFTFVHLDTEKEYKIEVPAEELSKLEVGDILEGDVEFIPTYLN